MKKILATLVTALVLSTSVALAAPNVPFADVPTNHWAFEAVNQLAKDGIIDGNNGKFNGDNTITRYEMAKIVAEALAKYEKADAKNKAMLDQLKSEFSPELGSLDLRIGELESVDSNFKFQSEVRIRYSMKTLNNDALNFTKKINLQEHKARFWMRAAIDDNWILTTRVENIQSMNVSGNEGGLTQAQAYLKGKVGQVDVTFGRLPYDPVYGFVTDNHQEGIKIGFGDRKANVRVTANYGRESASNIWIDGAGKYLAYGYTTAKSTTIPPGTLASGGKAYISQTRLASIEFAKDFSPVTSAEIGYLTYKGIDFAGSLGVPTAKFVELGLSTKFGNDIYLKASYVKSNAITENTGYIGTIKYKKYNLKQPGSWDVYYSYMHQEKNSTWMTTHDGLFSDNAGRYHGYKGPIIGFHIVPFKNAQLETTYTNFVATDDANWKVNNMIKSSLYIYF